MWHPLDVKGLVKTGDNQISITPDQGYSFCNCRNIFYTDWKNINQAIYDPEYAKKYSNPTVDELYYKTISKHFNSFKKQNGLFIDLGCITDAILDFVKLKGWDTLGIDIFARESKHKMLVGDIEYCDLIPEANVIWASHIFEHFKDPIYVAKKLYKNLEDGGYLFVAMPDPWFVNWQQPHNWLHWVLREHHILWDMDSFIDMMLELGYKLVSAERNGNPEMICSGDYHIIFQK